MGLSLSAPITGEGLNGEQLMVSTPVLHDGEVHRSQIWVRSELIARVTSDALAGVFKIEDDFDEPAEDPRDVLESWIGRFATNELWENDIHVAGWASNYNVEIGQTEDVDMDRDLPFLAFDKDLKLFVPVTPKINPEKLEVERAFTPRAMTFLLEKGVIE